MMRKSPAPWALFLLAACGKPSSNVPGTQIYLEAPDGKYHGPLMALKLEPSEATLEVAQSQSFEARGEFEDGTEIDVASAVYWEGTALEIAALGNLSGNTVPVRGASVGESIIKITIGTLEATAKITVLAASLRTLEIQSDVDTIPRGQSHRITVSGAYGDGRVEDVTALATWASSDEAVLRVGGGEKDKGVLAGLGNGQATVTATLDGITAEKSFTVACVYPAGPASVQSARVLPAVSWVDAYYPNNQRGDFGTEDFFCNDDAWGDKKGILFVISAGWCPACPEYLAAVAAAGPQIEAAGGQIVFMEAETDVYESASHDYAQVTLSQHVGRSVGIRVGDGETMPRADFFRTSPIITAFPSAFVVRKRDMTIMADQNDSAYVINWVEVFQKIDWDWSDPENPIPGFSNHCIEGQDEAFEPNDSVEQAAIIQSTVVDGGICNEQGDFYRIDIPGDWRLTLQFDNSVGNLDVFLWNEATNRPLLIGGERVGGISTTASVEVFRSSGVRLVKVEGVDHASAPYRMFVEAL
jgi:hypothetical protein